MLIKPHPSLRLCLLFIILRRSRRRWLGPVYCCGGHERAQLCYDFPKCSCSLPRTALLLLVPTSKHSKAHPKSCLRRSLEWLFVESRHRNSVGDDDDARTELKQTSPELNCSRECVGERARNMIVEDKSASPSPGGEEGWFRLMSPSSKGHEREWSRAVPVAYL